MEYGEEDNCLFGKVLGLKKDCITYEGEIISELKSDFEGAILHGMAAANFPSFPSHSNFATCFINKNMQNRECISNTF